MKRLTATLRNSKQTALCLLASFFILTLCTANGAAETISTGPLPFSDCPNCPMMMPIPSGEFQMGSPTEIYPSRKSEQPVRKIQITHSFALAISPVSVDQWHKCVTDKICQQRPAKGSPDPSQPVTDLSWRDVRTYIDWLNKVTGKPYRLPSEAEFEYAARAGSSTNYWWGNEMVPGQAVCAPCQSQPPKGLTPVLSGPTNPFGLHHMLGNVWEWTADCWNPTLQNVPSDGRAATTGECELRTIRGGSWFSDALNIRSAARIGMYDDFIGPTVGFRPALSLP